MRLTLVRHGLPESLKAAPGSRADPPLTPEGVRQARAMADWLAVDGVDRIFQSPALRARQTAEPLAEKLGLLVETVIDLDEYDRDSSEYLTVEEMRESGHPMWERLRAGGHPDGDAAGVEFVARVVAAVDSVIAAAPGQHAVAVCHGGVINAYLGSILGVDRMMWFDPGYTSISRIQAAGSGQRTVVSVNETGHLRQVDVYSGNS